MGNGRSNPLKYRQIEQDILAQAVEGKWEAGHKLPTEAYFVDHFRVSRNTVRQALAELESRGLIYRRRGLGSFYTGREGKNTKSHFLVGVMVSHGAYIYADIVRAAQRVLNPEGYHLVLTGPALGLPKDKAGSKSGARWRPDGYLLELWKPEMYGLMRNLLAEGVPFVLLNWISDDPRVSYVAPNDIAVGQSVFTYFHTRGHQRIAFVGILDNQPSDRRLKGLRDAAEDAGQTIPPHLIKLSEGLTSAARQAAAYRATRELIALGDKRPTAIFYFNDEEASQAYVAAREAGLSIPRDLSVIGVDNWQTGRALHPPLTTLEHPKARIGEMAARVLLDAIENPGTSLPVQVLYSCRLIERGSVRNLRDATVAEKTMG